LEKDYTGNDRSKANLMETLADSCRSIGNFGLSRRLLVAAKSIRNSLENRMANDTFTDANSDFLFARLEHDCGNYGVAEKLYLKCLTENGANAAMCDWDLAAETAFHLGRLQLAIQKNEDAKVHFEMSLETLRKLSRRNSFLAKACRVGIEFCDLKPGEVPSAEALAEFFKDDSWARKVVEQFSLILVHRAKGDYSKAASAYKKFLEFLKEKLPEDNQWYILALGDYAGIQHRAGYFEEAFESATFAISKGEKMAPSHPQLLRAKRMIGKELCRTGDCKAAYSYLKSVYDSNQNGDAGHTEAKIDKDLYFELIRCCMELRRMKEAQKYVLELKKGNSWIAEPEKAWLGYLEAAAFAESDIKRSGEAFKNAIATVEEMVEPPNNGIWCHRMAEVLVEDDKLERAIFFAEAAVAFDSKRFFDLHPRVSNRRMLLAKIYLLDGQNAKAKQQYALALKSRKRFLSPENRMVIETQQALDSVDDTL
jgi:tetratricopeptide (TPR) repeat protein